MPLRQLLWAAHALQAGLQTVAAKENELLIFARASGHDSQPIACCEEEPSGALGALRSPHARTLSVFIFGLGIWWQSLLGSKCLRLQACSPVPHAALQ